MRYSRTLPGPRYHTSTAVLLSEALKCILSLIGVLYTKSYRSGKERVPTSPLSDAVSLPLPLNRTRLRFGILNDQRARKFMTLLIPSLLYTIQNNLQFVAVSNLYAATFQVAYQGKILTTAICAVVLLGKNLSMTQWYSIMLLAAGVACASVPTTNTALQALSPHCQDHIRGIAAVSMACLISGFAGVYTESVLKRTQTTSYNGLTQRNTTFNFWLRNLQLCLASFVFAVLSVFIIDKRQIAWSGFWHGYNRTVWAVIVLQAVGGLTVAVVITYADNILKGFATSISVILSTMATVVLGQFDLTPLFLIGMVAVLAATHLYTMSSRSASATSNCIEYGEAELLESGQCIPVDKEWKKSLVT